MSTISVCLTAVGICERCAACFSGINLTFGSSENDEKIVDNEQISPSCGACLGMMEDKLLNHVIDEVSAMLNSSKYESETFSLALSLPQSLVLREKATLLYLKKNGLLKTSNLHLSIKDSLRQTLIPRIEKGIQKTHSNKSELLVDVIYKYKDDQSEISKLNPVLPLTNSNKRKAYGKKHFHKNKKSKEPDNSIQSIMNAVDKLNDIQLPHYTDCPPKSPTISCAVEVKACQGSLFVAGRYNKYSRELSQTPWFIDGVRKTESSVQEFICEKLQAFVAASESKFLSSGREDVDVMMLGRGRPFATELVDPKILTVMQTDLRKLQEQINASTSLIAVRDLQLVTREGLTKLKQGEEEKTKCYCAKIWCPTPIADEKIAETNTLKNIQLFQKTPLRVLHRRPIDTRKRLVHEMTMTRIDDEHYGLNLKTQAGTYVKEFVHSDFGRTVPSLCSLLDAPVDIFELDVNAVELDWPPKLDD